MKYLFDTENRSAGRAALGVIVLQADETVEGELARAFASAPVELYHARIPSRPEVTPETLAEMADNLPRAAELLPTAVGLRAIGYACTSGATVIGRDRVAGMIGRHHPGVPSTDPMTAVVAALRHLGVRRIGFLTPYLPEVSLAMRTLLEREGFEIAAFGSFEEPEEHVVANISERSTLAAMIDVGRAPACDAVFASCTNLRTFGILAEAEASLGKPAVSSNLALAWHMLRLAGVDGGGAGLGRLFG